MELEISQTSEFLSLKKLFQDKDIIKHQNGIPNTNRIAEKPSPNR
jgi:hypothetical protein